MAHRWLFSGKDREREGELRESVGRRDWWMGSEWKIGDKQELGGWRENGGMPTEI